MKTSSAKAKGRRLQQQVASILMEIGAPYGLEEGDVTSIGMGQNGADIVLSPAARRLFDLIIECKNVERLAVLDTFVEHFAKYQDKEGMKILVHNRNLSRAKKQQEIEKFALPLVTMRLADFAGIVAYMVRNEHESKSGPTQVRGFGQKKQGSERRGKPQA